MHVRCKNLRTFHGKNKGLSWTNPSFCCFFFAFWKKSSVKMFNIGISSMFFFSELKKRRHPCMSDMKIYALSMEKKTTNTKFFQNVHFLKVKRFLWVAFFFIQGIKMFYLSIPWDVEPLVFLVSFTFYLRYQKFTPKSFHFWKKLGSIEKATPVSKINPFLVLTLVSMK